ncbi:hypothetical protein ACTWP5_06520 [Streptomyces sp. 4N509B]|uniref:hypothetical protein n=1 Tax=Streptomyces sp. 4N509B TaxID=3457413 RepID=UPI003FD61544
MPAVPLVIAADGSYAARLRNVATTNSGDGGWCPERWTLDGPEPYAVRLPGGQPEEPDSPVVPLTDGRVLIGRRAGGSYHFSLLYPSGPDTGEVLLGPVECERIALLPPAPTGDRVYALVPEGENATALWLVCGGAFGPERVTLLAGRCEGGAWLDREGRLLALNRTDADGHTRAVTVTVDAPLGGPPTELLRIAEESNDRLLLADPDSGLLLVRSDAPGEERIGWGVMGSHRPVRFPEALHVTGVAIEPFAVQPEQVLLPEACAVALRMTTADAEWVAVWRPQQRELQHLAAPEGWLTGTGRWTVEGELLLPYASPHVPCGLLRVPVPVPDPEPGQLPEQAQGQSAAPATTPTTAPDGRGDALTPDAGQAQDVGQAPDLGLPQDLGQPHDLGQPQGVSAARDVPPARDPGEAPDTGQAPPPAGEQEPFPREPHGQQPPREDGLLAGLPDLAAAPETVPHDAFPLDAVPPSTPDQAAPAAAPAPAVPDPASTAVTKPVPLQQAPLGRTGG